MNYEKKCVVITMSLMTLFACPLNAMTVSDDLIAHYELNHSVHDQSKYLNHGERHGASFNKDRFDQNNCAIHFKQRGDYVNIDSILNDIKYIDKMSLSFWMKTDPGYKTLFQFTTDRSSEGSVCINPLEFIPSDAVLKKNAITETQIKLTKDIHKVKGFDIIVSFDPNVLQPLNILIHHVFNLSILNKIDFEKGNIHVVAAQSPIKTVQCDYLFNIKWQVLENHSTCLAFDNIELADQSAEMIPTCPQRKCWNTDDTMRLQLNSSSIELSIQNKDQLKKISAQNQTINDWIFVVITMNQDTTIYINSDEMVSSKDMPYTMVFSFANHVTIGSETSEPQNLIIDDFRIYKKVLSVDDIEKMYNEHLTIIPQFVDLPSEGGKKSIQIQQKYYIPDKKRSKVLDDDLKIFSLTNWLDVNVREDLPDHRFAIITQNYSAADKTIMPMPKEDIAPVYLSLPNEPFISNIDSSKTVDIFYESNLGEERYGEFNISQDSTLYTVTVIQAAKSVTISVFNPELEDAIQQATPGSHILIDNGIYSLENPLFVTKAITISSINGPEKCIISGSIIFRDTESTLSGLTLKNGYGSGIYSFGSKLNVDNCIITNCFINGLKIFQSAVNMFNCVIVHNNTSGISAIESQLNIIHCTLADNVFAAIETDNSTIKIMNSIVVHLQSGGFEINNTVLDITYSNISHNSIYKLQPETNMNEDPMFVSPEHNNYRLDAISPCLDSGLDLTQSDKISKHYDLDKQSRPQPMGSKPDLGAYENACGHQKMYIYHPKNDQVFCVKETTQIPLIWDTSENASSFRLQLYRSSIEPLNRIEPVEWVQTNYFLLPLEKMTLESKYFWTVETISAETETQQITGSFLLTNRSSNMRNTKAPSFLICFIETKQEIQTMNTLFQNNDYPVNVLYYDRYNTDMPLGWHRGMFLFLCSFNQEERTMVTLSAPKKYKIPSTSFYLKPFWFSVMIYHEDRQWFHWF